MQTSPSSNGVAPRDAKPESKFDTPQKLSAYDRWIAIALFFATAAYLCCFLSFSVINADEGVVLEGAERILRGQVVYRDFFSFYTPGSYYWTALLFKVFGNSIIVARTALVIYGGLFSVFTYLLARRAAPRWSALTACYVVAVTCLPFRFVALHNWDSTLLSLLALYSAVVLTEKPTHLRAFATGTFVSLAILFEHSKGAGLALGLLAGLALIAAKANVDRRRKLVLLGYVTGGVAWPLALTFVYFAYKNALSAMLSGWLWPLRHYSTANQLSYGFLTLSTGDRSAIFTGSWPYRLILMFLSIPYLLGLILPLLSVAIFLYLSRTRRQDHSTNSVWSSRVLISGTLSGLLLSVLATRRPDFTHLNYLAPLFCIPLAWILGGASLASHEVKAARTVLASLVLFSATLVGMGLLVQAVGAQSRLMTRRGELRILGKDQIVSYLIENTSPDEKIAIYPYQPLYYYLSQTESVSPFDFLQPGMHTPDQFIQEREAIARLQPRLVLFEFTFREKIALGWPGTPASALDSPDAVELFLLARYKSCAELGGNGFWRFRAMVPSELDCPRNASSSM